MIERDHILPGMIEQYVLGLCDEAEANMIEQLRKTDASLDSAILSFEEAFETINQGQGLQPSAAADQMILSKLRMLNKTELPGKVISISKQRFQRVKQLAVAASVLLVISAGYNIALFTKYKQQQTALLAKSPASISTLPLSDYNILKDPTITPIAMYGVGTHMICRCTMFWDKKTGKVYIMIHHLPLTDDTRDYQLWANVNGKTISVGLINDAIRDRFIEIDNMPEGATAFSVTLENAGGGATPSDDMYLSGKI